MLQKLLITGANGNLGSISRQRLGHIAKTIRLNARGGLGEPGPNEEIVYCDLSDKAAVDPHALVFRQVMLHGFWLAPMLTSLPRQELIETYDYLARLLIDGRLTIPIQATYPLDKIADALAAAGEGERDGKIVVTTDALNP